MVAWVERLKEVKKLDMSRRRGGWRGVEWGRIETGVAERGVREGGGDRSVGT